MSKMQDRCWFIMIEVAKADSKFLLCLVDHANESKLFERSGEVGSSNRSDIGCLVKFSQCHTKYICSISCSRLVVLLMLIA